MGSRAELAGKATFSFEITASQRRDQPRRLDAPSPVDGAMNGMFMPG
jgi:hypothetical protein